MPSGGGGGTTLGGATGLPSCGSLVPAVAIGRLLPSRFAAGGPRGRAAGKARRVRRANPGEGGGGRRLCRQISLNNERLGGGGESGSGEAWRECTPGRQGRACCLELARVASAAVSSRGAALFSLVLGEGERGSLQGRRGRGRRRSKAAAVAALFLPPWGRSRFALVRPPPPPGMCAVLCSVQALQRGFPRLLPLYSFMFFSFFFAIATVLCTDSAARRHCIALSLSVSLPSFR